jgi:hypothetical protein
MNLKQRPSEVLSSFHEVTFVAADVRRRIWLDFKGNRLVTSAATVQPISFL